MARIVDRGPAPPPAAVCPCARRADRSGICCRCQGLIARRLWADLAALWSGRRAVGPVDYQRLMQEAA